MAAFTILAILLVGSALVCLYGYLGARHDEELARRRGLVDVWVPRGARLFIPATTPIPDDLPPHARLLWQALRDFGAYVTDTGG